MRLAIPTILLAMLAVALAATAVSAGDDQPPQWHEHATSRISIDENRTQARYEHDQYHGAYVFAANDWGGDYRLVNYRIVQAGVPGWSLEVRRTHYTGSFNYRYFNLVYDGPGMDHETQDRTTLTVRATDGGGNHSDHVITVRVNDIDEIPGAPGNAAVLPRTGNRVIVQWEASENSGPPVTRYEVDWKIGDGKLEDAGPVQGRRPPQADDPQVPPENRQRRANRRPGQGGIRPGDQRLVRRGHPGTHGHHRQPLLLQPRGERHAHRTLGPD